MSSPIEPPAQQFSMLRARHEMAATTHHGCPMTAGLYLKANGELPCWCQVGERKILATIDREWLEQPENDLLGHPELVTIRRAFMNGELPYPELCGDCLARGGGTTESLRPEHFDRLLVEPSYLCQLDCPQCIAPKTRLRLKSPPYYLDPELFAAFLDRLRRDGVRSVRTIHFEGRGDPLLNRHVSELLRLARAAFPQATLQLTTHGSYPFPPFLLEGNLDILQVSADGARQESYARYRRGGDLEKVFALMRTLRDHRRSSGSRLIVRWKYILFEWNDSDDELALAARLADELEVKLIFILTESGPFSQRYREASTLFARLPKLAPRTRILMTTEGDMSRRLAELQDQAPARAERTWLALLDAVRNHDITVLTHRLAAALAADPGLDGDPLAEAVTTALAGPLLAAPWVERVITGARFPTTPSALGTLALENEAWAVAERAFRAYLALGPEAADRRHVEATILQATVRAHLGSDDPSTFSTHPEEKLKATEAAILAVDPGHRPAGHPATPEDPLETWLGDILLPQTLELLGYLRWARQDSETARQLFEAYLATGLGEEEAQPVRWALGRL